MLAKLCKGETVVVTKLDRLGRDTVDIVQTVGRLSGMGVKVVVLQLGNVDLTSSAGKLILSVLASVAEMERNLIRERTVAGLAAARKKGKIGSRPKGATETQRQQIIELSATGKPDATIARELGLGRATVRAALGKVPSKAKNANVFDKEETL